MKKLTTLSLISTVAIGATMYLAALQPHDARSTSTSKPQAAIVSTTDETPVAETQATPTPAVETPTAPVAVAPEAPAKPVVKTNVELAREYGWDVMAGGSEQFVATWEPRCTQFFTEEYREASFKYLNAIGRAYAVALGYTNPSEGTINLFVLKELQRYVGSGCTHESWTKMGTDLSITY